LPDIFGVKIEINANKANLIKTFSAFTEISLLFGTREGGKQEKFFSMISPLKCVFKV
jgi:hypothetical protein